VKDVFCWVNYPDGVLCMRSFERVVLATCPQK